MTGTWRNFGAAVVAMLWLGAATSAYASQVITPIDALGSTEQRPAANAINNSGISTDGAGDLVHDNVSGNMWNTSGDDIGWITFDLGEVQNDLDFIHLWNYNEGGGWYERGAKTIDIYTATTGTLASPDFGAKVGAIVLDIADGAGGYAGHNFRFGDFAPTTPPEYDGGSITDAGFALPAARFIRLDVQDTYDTADFVGAGLSEARFLATPRATPLLDYRFDDAAGSTVPNHGSIGSSGDATLNADAVVMTGSQPFARGDYVRVDAAGGLMSTADHDEIDTLDDMTLAFWIKANESTSQDWQDVMGDITVAAPNDAVGWNIQMMTGGVLRFRAWDGSIVGETNSDTGAVVQDVWNHITMVITGLAETGSHDLTVAYYLNGELLNEATVTATGPMADSADGFKLGNAMWDGELLADYGDVRLFGEALDAQQVEKNYLISLSIPTPAALPGGLVMMAALLLRRRV